MTLAGQEVDEATLGGRAVEAAQAPSAITCELEDEVVAVLLLGLAQRLLDRVAIDLAAHELLAQRRGPQLLAGAETLDEVGRECAVVDEADTLEPVELGLGHAHIDLSPQQEVADLGARLPATGERVHRDVLGTTLLRRILGVCVTLGEVLRLSLRAREDLRLARAGQVRDGRERVLPDPSR